jgi:membrane protein
MGTVILLLVTYAGAQLLRIMSEIRFPGTEYYFTSDGFLMMILSKLFFFIMLSCILFLLYMWVPTIEVKWHKALMPGVLAALAIMIANSFLGWYFDNWAYYHAVYGSLTTVIVILLWVYVCSNILIIGAALSSVISTPRR